MKPNPRTRARQACVACNSRRIKCDVVKQNPCTNCMAIGFSCVIRESRRGKHPRKPKKTANEQRHEPEDEAEARTLDVSKEPTSELDNPRISAPSPETAIHPESLQDSTDLAPVGWVRENPSSSHSSPQAGVEGPDLSRQIYDESLHILVGNDTAKTNAKDSHENPISGDPSPAQIDENVVCMGESTSISYLHDAHPPTAAPTCIKNTLFLVSADLRAQNPISDWDAERAQAKMRRLQTDGVLSFPPPTAVDKLFAAYFRWFHPSFPIVDEPEIKSQYLQSTLSPLLLQALLFVGAMHCEDEDLLLLKLGSRQRAKYVFYNRAKDLFDAEVETKEIIVIQALFLMSFWRAGALLQKDTRHWLGAAVSLAQTKGLHRSVPSQNTDTRSQNLRKRLWWCIYIRERQCAAALGLPNRIRDEDCDVENLHGGDFEFAFNSSSTPERNPKLVLCVIGMVELSQILGRIIHHDYLPTKRLNTVEREEIRNIISSWKSGPSNITQSIAEGDIILDFQAHMVNLAYNNLLILLHRSGCHRLNASGDDLSMRVVLQAASRNTSIIENMVVEGTMRHAQIHVITNVFNTLCVHTLTLRRSEGGRRYVSEHRAKICLLGLRELGKTWEVKNWILQLFFQYLDQPTAARLQIGADGSEPQTSVDEGTKLQDAATASFTCHQIRNQLSESSPIFDANWSMNTEDVGLLLQTQIENNFINGEGGSIDWYMADVLGDGFPP